MIEQEMWEAATTTRQALDYGDQEWVSGLFDRGAREIERLASALREIAEEPHGRNRSREIAKDALGGR